MEGAFKSIARDTYFIETKLNEHLDKLLEHAGQPVETEPLFAILSTRPKARATPGSEIDALLLKFELAEYGERALQAMGARR